MILDTDRNELQWHRVEYPIEHDPEADDRRGLPRRLVAPPPIRPVTKTAHERPHKSPGCTAASRATGACRVERPHAAFFRYSGPGTLVARETASVPRRRPGRALARVRHALFGRPLSIHEDIAERLSKKKALAIFSSDAISSSAYATEEILRVLVLAGAGALFLSLPIAIAIAFLLTVVSISYRQEIYAYPSGGGDYAVARANLPGIVRAHRRRRAAGRLRHDRRRVDLVGRRAGHLGRAGPRGHPGRDRRRWRSC